MRIWASAHLAERLNLLLSNTKLILYPFCFFDKIDSPFLLAELLLSFGCPFCSNFAKQILSRPSLDKGAAYSACQSDVRTKSHIYTCIPYFLEISPHLELSPPSKSRRVILTLNALSAALEFSPRVVKGRHYCAHTYVIYIDIDSK